MKTTKRILGLLVLALAVVLVVFVGTSVAATPTTAIGCEEHEHNPVTICHATPPDTAANGYQVITVDDDALANGAGGHDPEHDMDIIPDFWYWHQTGGDWANLYYPGKNWDSTGQAIWANGCVVPPPPDCGDPYPVVDTKPPECVANGQTNVVTEEILPGDVCECGGTAYITHYLGDLHEVTTTQTCTPTWNENLQMCEDICGDPVVTDVVVVNSCETGTSTKNVCNQCPEPVISIETDQWSNCGGWERSARLLVDGQGASSFVVVDSGTWTDLPEDLPGLTTTVTFVDGPPEYNGIAYDVTFPPLAAPTDCGKPPDKPKPVCYGEDGTVYYVLPTDWTIEDGICKPPLEWEPETDACDIWSPAFADPDLTLPYGIAGFERAADAPFNAAEPDKRSLVFAHGTLHEGLAVFAGPLTYTVVPDGNNWACVLGQAPLAEVPTCANGNSPVTIIRAAGHLWVGFGCDDPYLTVTVDGVSETVLVDPNGQVPGSITRYSRGGIACTADVHVHVLWPNGATSDFNPVCPS